MDKEQSVHPEARLWAVSPSWRVQESLGRVAGTENNGFVPKWLLRLEPLVSVLMAALSKARAEWSRSRSAG